MTWQQVQAYGPVLLALVVVTATMVLWWRMPLRRATEADAPVDGIDEPAIIAATEPAGKEDPATPIARLQSNIDSHGEARRWLQRPVRSAATALQSAPVARCARQGAGVSLRDWPVRCAP